MRFAIDASVRRVGDGKVVIGGSPLKLFRLTDRGGELIDAIERGDQIDPTAATNLLIDRLLDAGVLHPHFGADDNLNTADVTVIIPAFNTPAAILTRLVEECSMASRYARVEVVIVDDASQPPLAPVHGARVVRREFNGGPGAARSTGLAHVTTSFVAFIDTDVELIGNWLQQLLVHFADERVGLVAPRVSSKIGANVLARYEVAHSPLDLGPRAARVRAGTRVSYVPAAVIVCRVRALSDVGGFDDTMRLGEDVDLVWRLDEAGWRVRYEPCVTVTHRPRASFDAWLRQRYNYGTSAAPLAARHRGALAPLRISGWSAATWLAVAAGLPVVGGVIAASTTAMLARKLRNIPDGGREAIRLAGLGHLFASRSIASALTRAWWPMAALAALVSRRARRVVIIAALAPAIIEWLRAQPDIDPLRYVGLRLLDDAAYGVGVMHGSARARSIDALIPDLSSWPKTTTSTTSTKR